jgi:VWFA-related protein
MQRLFVTFIGFVLTSSSLAVLGQSSQTSASDQASTPTIHATSQEVVLDIVFRDQHGQTIRNVRPEEIHVTEDGVEQKLSSFRLVDGTTPAAENAPLDPMRQIRLVSFVFEGLDPDGKRFFRQSLKDALDLAPEQNLYFSIMAIDQKLHVLQPFTADHAALLKVADQAAKWSFVQYSKQSEQVESELKQTIDSAGANPALQAGAQGGPSSSQVHGAVALKMAQMQYDMLQSVQAGDATFNARNTIDALMRLVKAESELPGRKAILYFNPFLVIPEQMKEQYLAMISAANRANVSFYTVDPKGLVTWDQNGMGRSSLGGATGQIRDAQLRGGVGEVTPGQAHAAENAEGALRQNPLLWLRDLAQQTGGVTIAETNDTKAPLRIALDEVRSYYEGTYTPHIASYDGRFHKISVRIDRPGIVAHARSGYFAVPALRGIQQLNAFEMPLLGALNAAQAPSDVAFQAAAERFNERGPKVEYMVTLETPLKGLEFAPQPDHKTDSVDAALLAVVKDSHGEIVQKFSKDFAVQVEAAKVDGYKAGNLVQTFHTELAPGSYSLESAVMDRKNNKVGVKKSSFTVPEPSSKLSMSDIVIVRSTEKVSGDQVVDAFYLPGGKIVPTLTNTLKGGAGNVLPFYFTIYPDRSIKDAPKMTISFYKGGQLLGSAEAPPLPAVQQDGRIPYNLNLPADKFTPGSWQIEFGVTQGDSKAQEKVEFQVE